MTSNERYEQDPAFRAFVDTIIDQILRHNYTPPELQEALILAIRKYVELFFESLHKFVPTVDLFYYDNKDK